MLALSARSKTQVNSFGFCGPDSDAPTGLEVFFSAAFPGLPSWAILAPPLRGGCRAAVFIPLGGRQAPLDTQVNSFGICAPESDAPTGLEVFFSTAFPGLPSWAILAPPLRGGCRASTTCCV